MSKGRSGGGIMYSGLKGLFKIMPTHTHTHTHTHMHIPKIKILYGMQLFSRYQKKSSTNKIELMYIMESVFLL